jgi:hypothetical protein
MLALYDQSHSDLMKMGSAELVKTLASESQNSFPLAMAKKLCSRAMINVSSSIVPRTTVFDKEGFNLDPLHWFSMQNAAPVIHQQLEMLRPVGVSYDARFLRDPKSQYPLWHYSWENYYIQGKNRDLHRHASLIVGQRWNRLKHRCEFMLRNSWGSKCNYANPLFQGSGCEAGMPFVPERDFETQIYAVQSFSGFTPPPWTPILK